MRCAKKKCLYAWMICVSSPRDGSPGIVRKDDNKASHVTDKALW